MKYDELINGQVNGVIESLEESFILMKSDKEEVDGLIEWIIEEYKNYFLIGRDTYANTLNAIKLSHPLLSPMLNVLLSKIDTYAMPKCFLLASIKMKKDIDAGI